MRAETSEVHRLEGEAMLVSPSTSSVSRDSPGYGRNRTLRLITGAAAVALLVLTTARPAFCIGGVPAPERAAIKSLEEQVLAHARLSFAAADRHHDGLLDPDEAKLLGMRPDEFLVWDRNRDEKLSFAELIQGGMVKLVSRRLREMAAKVILTKGQEKRGGLSKNEFVSSGLAFYWLTPPISGTPSAEIGPRLFAQFGGASGRLDESGLLRVLGQAEELGYGVSLE